MHIDHIDSNSSNDVPSNIRVVTRKQNNSRKHARLMKHLNHTNTRHENEMIKSTNVKTGEVTYYRNGMAAAKGIGCSHVLVYRCLNPNDYATTAKAHKLEWVAITDGIIKQEDIQND